MKITADTSSSITTAKQAFAERLQKPASTQAQSTAGGDVVTISAQARSLAAASTAEAAPLAGTPRPALEVPGASAGPESAEKTTGKEQEQRAPERAVAQSQQGAQAAQGRINLLV